MRKIGIAGLGVGKAFFDVVKQMEDVAVGAICDVDETRLRQVGNEQGIASVGGMLFLVEN